MVNDFSQGNNTIIVGAGPYGLSLAQRLHADGLPFRIFGKAMETWATQMPRGMCLRSGWHESSVSPSGKGCEPDLSFAAQGRDASSAPVALADFVTYGENFARNFVPELETDYVRSIDRQDAMFRITTATGERLLSRRVVIATGLNNMQHIPLAFRHLPNTRVTHPSQHSHYEEFRGREVTVIGAGGSALTAAALLHEAGGRVTLIARTRALRLDGPARGSAPSRNGMAHMGSKKASGRSGLGLNPSVFRWLPSTVQSVLQERNNRPSGDRSLHGRLEGFPVLLGSRIHAIEPADGACDRLRITLTDSRGAVHQHLTSHLICATGYRYDKSRLQMLSQSLREQIRVGRHGAPKLNSGFESSVPGLHFIGPLAAPSFGPLLGSLAGTGFAAQRMARTLQAGLERESQQADRKLSVAWLPSRQRTP